MNDIRDGKVTLPLLIAVSRAPESEAEEIRRVAEELATQPAGTDAYKSEQLLKSFVMRYDGVRYAYQQMRRHKEMACQCLSVFRESAAKDSLSGLVEYAVSRLY
jgi:octaprenyl-diphosphate synthase